MEPSVEAEGDQLIGRQLGDYRIGAFLGRGGMGTVYLARQLSSDRDVALKVLHSVFHESRVQRRFEREVRVLAALEHPSIARLYDSGETTIGGLRVHYIAMERVRDARTLVDFATATGLDRDGRLRLFAEVCRAVEHAHQWGVVHRDLKPANVLVDGDGRIKVIDFGIARAQSGDGTLTASGDVVGTPAYMSPEQLGGEADRIGPRADVYALGVILYELLTGQLPHGDARESAAALARRGAARDPTPPGRIDRGLRGDLEILLAARSRTRLVASARIRGVVRGRDRPLPRG